MAILEQLPIESEETVLRDVRILNTGHGVVEDAADVHVVNGRIKGVGKNVRGGAGCVDVPGEGLIAVPGLIDCHAHILSPFLTKQEGYLAPWTIKQIGRNLRSNLAAGVVLVKDMLSPIRIMNKVRWLLAKGKLCGPDILASGAILSCAEGYPEFIFPIPWPLSAMIGTPKYHLSTPQQAQKAVRYLCHCGADHIKVGYTSRPREYEGPRMPVVSKEVLDAICETSHALGRRVSVHHNWTDDLEPILQSDVDTLEHLCNDRPLTDEEVAFVKSRGVTITPTLTVTHNMSFFDKKSRFMGSRAADEMFEPEARKHLQFVVNTWLDENERSYHDVFGFWRANLDAYFNAKKSAEMLHRAEVQLLCGTDFGAVVAYSGEQADEVARLSLIGMTNLEAIRAATSHAARFLNVHADYGAVAVGRKADFFLVQGNPLEDITALRNVKMVGKNGNWFRIGGDTTTPMWDDDYEFV